MSYTYNYYGGLPSNQRRYTVEIDTVRDICVVDLGQYINGADVFPCGSGNDRRLSSADKLAINKILEQHTGIKGLTGFKAKKLRAKLEQTIKSNTNGLYDWADCVRHACSELDINDTLLQMMYPTTEEYLAIIEFRHIND